MIKLQFIKRKPDPQIILPPEATEDDKRYIRVGQGVRVRKRRKLVGLIGNLLIIVGLLMLVGIGGWYGYTQWGNQRFKEEFAAKGGLVDPSVEETPTPAPTPPPPLPVLSSTGTSMIGILNRLPAEIDDSPPITLSIHTLGTPDTHPVNIESKIVPVSWKMIPSKGGEKSEWQVADFAVGHHFGSANPGQQGNVVLSGHVDYKGQVFKDLDKLIIGDEVTVFTQKGQYLYVVTGRVLVKEEGVSEEKKRSNAAYMNPTSDPTLTMITCWPYGIDDYRLIVIAKPYQSALSAQSEYVIR